MTLTQVFLLEALHLLMSEVVLMNACFSSQCKQSGAFSVVVDNYVSDDDSTGVVHQAPYFGAVSHIYIVLSLNCVLQGFWVMFLYKAAV